MPNKEVPAKKFEVPAKKSTVAKTAAAKITKTATAKTGEQVVRKSSLFRLRNEAKTVWSAFKGQKADIAQAFMKLGAAGAKAKGVTRAALCAALPDIGPNNISFYLSGWQKTEPALIEKLEATE